MLAKADGSLYFNEWYTDGTNWYYFSGYVLVTDGNYYVNDVKQMFDANGVWLGEFTTDKVVDGWNVINGKYYYGYAGYVYSSGTYSIGGEWYAFRNNGMVTNDWYNGRYFGADGKMVKYAAGWNLINGKWAYFDNKHQIMRGWVYEGTAAYYIKSVYDETPYSDGELLGYEMVTGYYAMNGDLYYFGSNGVCQGAVVEDGWYAYGADWYYVADGEAADGEYEINGTTYVFEAGKMVANDISYGRYLDANGNVVSAEGWYVFNGHWIYITADGYVARGLHLIGATEYYFDGYGYWVA
jgi:glucan-binding YG repeat protein